MPRNPHSRSSNMDTWALWKKALPIERGRYKCSDQGLVEDYYALLESKPGAFSALGSIANILADMAEGELSLEPEKRTTPEERVQLNRLSDAIDRDCIKRLQLGALTALGFSVPRHPDDTPRILPTELLIQGFISFERETVRGEGLEFCAVRIIPTRDLERPTIESSPSARPGRPSKRDLIKQVYAECRDLGLIDYTKPQKAAIEVVRDRIQIQHPAEYGAGKGFGHEVIRDCIADDFGQRTQDQKL